MVVPSAKTDFVRDFRLNLSFTFIYFTYQTVFSIAGCLPLSSGYIYWRRHWCHTICLYPQGPVVRAIWLHYISVKRCPQLQNHVYTFICSRYRYKDPESSMKLQKVFLFWICPNTNSFEWFAHLLKDLEHQMTEAGTAGFLDYNIYLTRGWDANQVSIFILKSLVKSLQ